MADGLFQLLAKSYLLLGASARSRALKSSCAKRMLCSWEKCVPSQEVAFLVTLNVSKTKSLLNWHALSRIIWLKCLTGVMPCVNRNFCGLLLPGAWRVMQTRLEMFLNSTLLNTLSTVSLFNPTSQWYSFIAKWSPPPMRTVPISFKDPGSARVFPSER